MRLGEVRQDGIATWIRPMPKGSAKPGTPEVRIQPQNMRAKWACICRRECRQYAPRRAVGRRPKIQQRSSASLGVHSQTD